MFYLVKRVFILFLLICSFWIGTILADHQFLTEDLIRIHIVGSSDEYTDQQIKLKVRDAVISSLTREMENIRDPKQARRYIQDNIPKIQAIANRTMTELGLDPDAVVTFCREEFDVRHCESISLPSGIYHCLRITLGEGEGRNWWCVAFPRICSHETEYMETVAQTGLTDTPSDSIKMEEAITVRFYLLDIWGRIEKFVRQG